MVYADFMEHLLETMKISISPVTYDGYSYMFKAHIVPYFKAKKLKVKDVTPYNIQEYVNYKLSLGLSPNTVHRQMANISKCLNSAVKQNIIAFNPAKRIEMPKKERFTGAKFYNEKQIEQLLECSKGGPLEIALLLTLFYGIRQLAI